MNPGEVLAGRYLIARELGRGGMGAVFEAHDAVLDRDVAIKIILTEPLSEAARERMMHEARVVARMDHPSVTPIYDLGTSDRGLFLVMPVLRGRTLRELLDAGPLPAPVVAMVGLQVARALDYSHGLGIVHRDIKPENIMVLGASHDDVPVKVMDFGIATDENADASTPTGLTGDGAGVVGTVEYLSPEQAVGKPVDGRTDVYALGVVLYECLIGEPPFCGPMMRVLHRIVHERPRSPGARGADVAPALDALIARCLEKDPDARPATAGEVADALREVPRAGQLPDGDARRGSGERAAITTRGGDASLFTTALLNPMIGRAGELEALAERADAAAGGALQLVAVQGTVGAGKSRLLRELDYLAGARGMPVYRGRCVNRDETFPYQGFCDVIRDFFTRAAHADDQLIGRLRARFGELAAQLVHVFPALGSVPVLRELATARRRAQQPGSPGNSPGKLPLLELLAEAITRIADGKPIAIALDDLHYEDASAEALQYLFHRLQSAPVLAVVTYHPFHPARREALGPLLKRVHGQPRFCELALEPLAPAEHTKLVAALLPAPAAVPAALADRLHDVTGGNPMFACELVRSLVETEALVLEGGAWALVGDDSVTYRLLPSSLHEMIAFRLARADEPLRAVLAGAAVLGERFTARDLALVFPERGDLESECENAIGAGYLVRLEERGDAFAFASSAIRRVLLSDMPAGQRAELHERCATALESAYHGAEAAIAHALAYHFAAAGRADDGLRYAVIAGRSALAMHSPEEAIRAVRPVLALLSREHSEPSAAADAPAAGSPPGSPREGEALMLLADAYEMAGDHAAALAEAERAVAAFERAAGGETGATASGSAGAIVAAMVRAAQLSWRERRIDDAAVWARRGVEFARAAGEREHVAALALVGYEAAVAIGDEAAAVRYAADAAAHAEPVSPGEPAGDDTGEAADEAAAGVTPRPGRGQREPVGARAGSRPDIQGVRNSDSREAVTAPGASAGRPPGRASDGGDPGRDIEQRRILHGEALLIHGEYLAAREAFESAHHALRARGDTGAGEEVRHLLRLATLARQLGRYAEAHRRCADARQLLGDGDALLAAQVLAVDALVHCQTGQFEDANHRVRDGFALLAESAEGTAEVRAAALEALYRAQGNLLLGRGRPREAVRAYERTLTLATAGTWERSIAEFNVGHACAVAGHHDRALEHLTRVLTLQTERGDRWGIAHTHTATALVHTDRGDFGPAREAAATGLCHALDVADPKLIAIAYLAAARVELAAGALAAAERSYQLALRDATACRARPEITEAELGLARVHLAVGKPRLAREHADRARALAYAHGASGERGAARLLLGQLDLADGALDRADEHLGRARRLAAQVGNPYRELDVECALADLDLARSRAGAALARLAEAHEWAHAIGARVHGAEIWRARAQAHRAQGDGELASRADRQAMSEFRTLGIRPRRVSRRASTARGTGAAGPSERDSLAR